jgi:hypothetical protein
VKERFHSAVKPAKPRGRRKARTNTAAAERAIAEANLDQGKTLKEAVSAPPLTAGRDGGLMADPRYGFLGHRKVVDRKVFDDDVPVGADADPPTARPRMWEVRFQRRRDLLSERGRSVEENEPSFVRVSSRANDHDVGIVESKVHWIASFAEDGGHAATPEQATICPSPRHTKGCGCAFRY